MRTTGTDPAAVLLKRLQQEGVTLGELLKVAATVTPGDDVDAALWKGMHRVLDSKSRGYVLLLTCVPPESMTHRAARHAVRHPKDPSLVWPPPPSPEF